VSARSIVLVAVLFAACNERAAQAPVAESPDVYALSRAGQVAGSAGPTVTRPASVETKRPMPLPGPTTAMIIRTAQASIEVDSLEPAVAQVRAIADALTGYIANVVEQTGSGQLRQAMIELKIPAERFDQALRGLRPIGKIESVNVTAADVGEEFVDVTARMENARRLERRLLELLGARTGKLADVLEVEQSLARVREEIERAEGRLRYLRAHVATSTILVTLHEPVPVVGAAGRSVLGQAFKQSWRNFVLLIALAVEALGVVVPLGVVALLVWLVTRRLRGARVNA
jgi:hypothetical protein